MKTNRLLLIFTLSILVTPGSAQLKSVTFSTIGSTALEANGDWKIEKVNGWGGEIDVKYNVGNNFELSITAGYQQLKIDQDRFALFAEYNWKYWSRYFGDINDPNFKSSTQWVQTVLKDSTYSATFNPVQKMDLFPVTINIAYLFNLSENITVKPILGLGIAFYQKHLYIEETWKKRFPELDNYVYSYSFHDMAENVNGNPIIAQVGCEANYSLTQLLQLSAAVKYSSVFRTIESSGFRDFPMKDIFSAKIGISFLY